ncbi:MAG: DNA polymerase [Candidatus Parcubacteria bacterium]|nr:MAG: DNA polymerase [Candidatus Parcubacteria bacterium]
MKVFLIDANALIYRIYHAMPNLVDSQGRPVQALYGLSNILLKILKEQKPDYIFALYDRPEPTIRHQVFKEYKATRQPITDDLKIQISLAKKIFSAFNIPVIEKIGYEADDLIASLKEKFLSSADEIVILTGDLDTLQLVDQKTKILTMKKGITQTIIYDEKQIKEKYGLLPQQLPDYKALIGDPSDNIIGISGIGPKTASQLLQQYQNLEGIIKAAEEKKLEPKFREKILAYKEKLLFNRELVTLRKDIEIDQSLLKPYSGFKNEELISVFREFGFKSLIQRIQAEKENKGLFAVLKMESKTITSLCELKKPFFFFLDKDQIKIDDGSGEIKILTKNFLREIFLTDGEKYVFDLKNIFKEIFKDDFYFDKKLNLNKIYDLKIIFWLLNPSKGNLNLEEIIAYQNPNIKQPLISALETTKNLLNKLKELELEKVYFEIELPLVGILARMELRGIKIDIEALEEFKRKIKEKCDRLLEEIYDLAGEKFNPNSPLQLRKILFTKLKIPTKGLTKTSKGEISTQETDLIKIIHLHPIISKILDYRKTNKLLTTYTDSLLKTYNPQTKRIYTIFNQTGTSTGRITSENPNLQNLPLEGELAQYLRKVFIAEEGYVFLDVDYSQIELRLLAHLSQDENLISAFKNDLDIHSQTAKMVFGDDSSESRRKAKIINFGICYGVTAKGLAERLQLPVSLASKLIEKFYYFYPGVKKLKEELIEFAKTYSYAQTLFGRKKFIPEINYQSYRERALAERIAINMPIQGLAADLLKKAMITIDEEIYQKNLPAYFILTIHDELVFEVKEEMKEEIKVIIKEKMENMYKLTVPLRVNLKEGSSLS